MVRAVDSGEVLVRALKGVAVLISWARHFTLAVPLSTQVCNWVLVKWSGQLNKTPGAGGPAMD